VPLPPKHPAVCTLLPLTGCGVVQRVALRHGAQVVTLQACVRPLMGAQDEAQPIVAQEGLPITGVWGGGRGDVGPCEGTCALRCAQVHDTVCGYV
jgi:hypothetical protein